MNLDAAPGPILSVPSSLQDELYKDLQETGMLQFAQHAGVLPGFRSDHWPESNVANDESMDAQQATACLTGPGDAAGSKQTGHLVASQQAPAGAAAETCSLPAHIITESELAHANEINQAADGAVAEAMSVLAAARHGMQALAGAGPSSSNASDGQAPDLHGMCSSFHTGQEDESSSGARRRRSGVRLDQNSSLAAAAAAATAAAAAGNAGATGKAGKGLRHFSMKVCEKVESKGTTSYNEVADELVAEMRGVTEDGTTYDEKNIRRRVYDAINVLMALDIIAKEKKAILWKGFPSSRSGGSSTQRLASERATLASSVDRKAETLSELIKQQQALKHLLHRNSTQPAAAGAGTALQLPFILVQAKPDATVEVHISQDMRDVEFDFYNSPFQIHDDTYVLRMMAMESKAQKQGAPAAAHGPSPAANSSAAAAATAGGSFVHNAAGCHF